MIKRTAAVLLILSICVSVLTGCITPGGNSGGNDGSRYTLTVAHKECEYKDITDAQDYLYVAIGKELTSSTKDAVTVRLHIGLDTLLPLSYELNGATAFIRVRAADGTSEIIEIGDILADESIFVDYSYARLSLTADKLPYYKDVTVPRSVLPDLYDAEDDKNISLDTIYIDVIFEAPAGYYRRVRTLEIDYKRLSDTRKLTLPSGYTVEGIES